MLLKIDKSKTNPLISAYQEDNIKKFKQLIESGESVNCLDEDDLPLIYTIIENKNKFTDNKLFFDEILSQDVILDPYGKSKVFLNAALKKKDIYYMEKLLQKGINPNGYKGMKPPILSAIKNKDFDKIKLLLENNANINKIKYNRLNVASTLFNQYRDQDELTKVMKLFIEHGLDLNEKSTSTHQAIHAFARSCDDIDLFNLMIKNGSKVNATDQHGVTPLIVAILVDNIECAKILIENGASVNHQNDKGISCLMYLAQTYGRVSSKEIMNIMLEKNADIFAVDLEGNNFAHYLFNEFTNNTKDFHDNDHVLHLIKKNKKLLSMKNKSGLKPIDIVKKNKDTNLYQKLENTFSDCRSDL